MLDVTSPAPILELRSILDASGYSAFVNVVRAVQWGSEVAWPNFANLREAADQSSTHRGLLHLLALGLPVAPESLAPWLSAGQVEALKACGLLVPAVEGRVQTPSLGIVPFLGGYYLADLPAAYPTARRRQQVACLDRDSVFLAHQLPIEQRELTVDVCSGAGLLAISSSWASRRTIGLEIDATAIAVARFNSVLNGMADRVAFRRSDLYSALEGEQADLVVANPPYIPMPSGSCHEKFWAGDGGLDGVELLRRLLLELPERLKRGGRALMIGGSLASSAGLHCEASFRSIALERGLTVRLLVTARSHLDSYVAEMKPFMDSPDRFAEGLRAMAASEGCTDYAAFVLSVAHADGRGGITVSEFGTRPSHHKRMLSRPQQILSPVCPK